MTSQTTKNRFHETGETEVTQYKAIEPMAAISLILGLASFMTVFDLAGCFVAAPAIIFGLLSLVRIKKRPEVFIGRKAAFLSIVFALFFCSTGIAHRVTVESLTRHRAAIFGQEFLERIANGQPEIAFQWHLPPRERHYSDSDIWAFYKANNKLAEALDKFVNKKDIRTLLTIGSKAKIYPVGRASYALIGNVESVNQSYAIDFPSEGKTKTFFFAVLLRRTPTENAAPTWQITDFAGGTDPWKNSK